MTVKLKSSAIPQCHNCHYARNNFDPLPVLVKKKKFAKQREQVYIDILIVLCAGLRAVRKDFFHLQRKVCPSIEIWGYSRFGCVLYEWPTSKAWL